MQEVETEKIKPMSKFQIFKYTLKRNKENFRHRIYTKLLEIILNRIPDSYTVNHAKFEFLLAGYKPIEQCEEDPDKWIQQSVINLLKLFSTQGHSGFSAPFAIDYFSKLAKQNIITPLTGEDNEWSKVDCGEEDSITYQNKRLSSVFKEGKNGPAYYLDAIHWVDEKGISFSGGSVKYVDKQGNEEEHRSRQYINFPFIPKTFYIDVKECFNVSINDSEFYIVNKKQLDEALKYYSIKKEK